MKLEFHPEAEQEFLEAAAHYETEIPGLGERFHAEVNRATDLLLQYPEIGPIVDAPLRKLVLDRFPYFLIYRISAETVRVLAVAHEKRRPGYWQARA